MLYNHAMLDKRCFYSCGISFFYENDEQKVKGIIQKCPLFVCDDKVELIRAYSGKNIKSIYIDSSESRIGGPVKQLNQNAACISTLEEAGVLNALKILYGAANWKTIEREAKSDNFFRKLIPFGFVIRSIFKPEVINEMRDNGRRAVIYAPNHIKTIDPLILESVLKTHVHWAALKRFFDGRDSIFNNSKNPILCRITKVLFKRLDYFPIVRKWDKEKESNARGIRDMYRFLTNGFSIGIFPEGTTRKEGERFFGDFDKGFAELAINSEAHIQPVLICWKKKPIIYFGDMIDPKGMNVESIMDKYVSIQCEAFNKCREYIEKK